MARSNASAHHNGTASVNLVAVHSQDEIVRNTTAVSANETARAPTRGRSPLSAWPIPTRINAMPLMIVTGNALKRARRDVPIIFICRLTIESVVQHSITGEIVNQRRFSCCTSNLSTFLRLVCFRQKPVSIISIWLTIDISARDRTERFNRFR